MNFSTVTGFFKRLGLNMNYICMFMFNMYINYIQERQAEDVVLTLSHCLYSVL